MEQFIKDVDIQPEDPEFQVALNKNLEKDSSRREKALQVLGAMLSEEGENMTRGRLMRHLLWQ